MEPTGRPQEGDGTAPGVRPEGLKSVPTAGPLLGPSEPPVSGLPLRSAALPAALTFCAAESVRSSQEAEEGWEVWSTGRSDGPLSRGGPNAADHPASGDRFTGKKAGTEQASQRLHGLRLLAASLSLAHPLDHLTSSSRQPPNYPSPLLVCLHSAPEAPLGPAAWGLCPWEDRGPGGVGR